MNMSKIRCLYLEADSVFGLDGNILAELSLYALEIAKGRPANKETYEYIK